MLPLPSCRFLDLERVGRSYQHLREEPVRVQRYRRQHLIELFLRDALAFGVGYGFVRRSRSSARRLRCEVVRNRERACD
jgi:hypothetical protein